MKLVDDILHYWFGHVEDTGVPTKHRAEVWFGNQPAIDQEIKTQFEGVLQDAIARKLDHWKEHPRSLLALIIVLDQFSRHIYRETPAAFEQDPQALDLCLKGIKHKFDHEISLIERAFIYMPLMHSEDLQMQLSSVKVFKMLADLSFPETHEIFFQFLTYAVKHYEVIKAYGRFPQRNAILGRESTADERRFLEGFEQDGWNAV